MIKCFFSIMLISIICTAGFSQQSVVYDIYPNKDFLSDQETSYYSDGIKIDTNFYLAGLIETAQYENNILVSKFSLKAGLDTSVYISDSLDLETYKVIKDISNDIYIIGNVEQNGNKYWAKGIFVIKLSKNLDVIWSKVYEQNVFDRVAASNALINTQGNLIVCGNGLFNNSDDIVFIEISPIDGSILKSVASPSQIVQVNQLVESVINLNSGGYLVLGNSARSLFKFDESFEMQGSLLFNQDPDSILLEDILFIMETGIDSILVVSDCKEYLTNGNINNALHFATIDPNGNVLSSSLLTRIDVSGGGGMPGFQVDNKQVIITLGTNDVERVYINYNPATNQLNSIKKERSTFNELQFSKTIQFLPVNQNNSLVVGANYSRFTGRLYTGTIYNSSNISNNSCESSFSSAYVDAPTFSIEYSTDLTYFTQLNNVISTYDLSPTMTGVEMITDTICISCDSVDTDFEVNTLGNTAFFVANIFNADNIIWKFSDSSTYYGLGLIKTFPQLGEYPFCVSMWNDCSQETICDTVRLGQHPISNLVWPGNTNHDFTVDLSDLLYLGLYFGSTGPQRDSVDITWEGKNSIDWAQNAFNGENIKHCDANGDGIVDIQDTSAIFSNYLNKVVEKKSISEVGQTPLYIKTNKSEVKPGEWAEFTLQAGNTGNLIDSLYGISFSLSFDNSLFESDSSFISFKNSFVGENADIISMDKVLSQYGVYEGAIVRNDHQNVTGQGNIATVYLKTKAGIENSTPASLSINNYQAITSTGDSVLFDILDSSETLINPHIGVKSYLLGESIQIYPIPTKDKIYVQLGHTSEKIQLYQVELLSIEGKVVENFNIPTGHQRNLTLELENHKPGIYFCKFYANHQVVYKKTFLTN